MSSLLTDVQADVQAARTALLAGDYVTALSRALCAQSLLAGIPDTRHGESGLQFQAQTTAIESLIANIRRQQSASIAASSTAVRRRNITYTAPDATEAYA